jgi:hypothetical protein
MRKTTSKGVFANFQPPTKSLAFLKNRRKSENVQGEKGCFWENRNTGG